MILDANPEARPSPVDPRIWNLAVGLGLVGCAVGPGAIDEGQSTSTNMGSDTTGDPEDDNGDGDWGDGDGEDDYGNEDYGDCDCPDNWWCLSGVCYPPQCYYDYDCELFEACANYNCVDVGDPLPDCPSGLDIPTEIPLDAPALALSFIDLDDDGRDHLVVATETELRLYEFGVGAPTIVPREWNSTLVQSMVVGQFDDQLGEDLLLLVNPNTQRYFSDGATNLVNPTSEPFPDSNGLIAGDFDGQLPTDLLYWGATAGLHFGAMPVELSDQYTEGAAAFPLGSFDPGVSIKISNDRWNDGIAIFDLGGNLVAEQQVFITGSLVAIESPGAAAYMGSWQTQTMGGVWSTLDSLDPDTGDYMDSLFVPGALDKLAVADLDGDLYDDLIADDGSANIIFEPLGVPCRVEVELGIETYSVREFAAGDHDGDGDDEVAVRLIATGESIDRVFIIDGEQSQP